MMSREEFRDIYTSTIPFRNREYLETENKMGACLHAIAAISGSDEVG